jgi:hypothetical protein
VKRSAGVNCFVLSDVADEQDAIVRPEPLQERVHLLRARRARFVEDVESLLIRGPGSVFPARQVPLQRARLDAGFANLWAAREVGAKPWTS